MKKSMLLSICCLLPWVFGACERHDWEETKKLHEAHGGQAGHAAADAHKADAHAAAAGHEAPEGKKDAEDGE